MKRILFALFTAVIFVSCTKEEEKHSYAVENDFGYSMTIFISEYNDANEKIHTMGVDLADKSRQTFVAKDNAVKLKIMIDKVNNRDFDRWIDQVFYLDSPNTSITIDGEVIVSTKEP